MDHGSRLQNPKGEGFRNVKGDACLRMLLIPYGQILPQDQFQVSPPLRNHIGFVFIRAAEVRAQDDGAAEDVFRLHLDRIPLHVG